MTKNKGEFETSSAKEQSLFEKSELDKQTRKKQDHLPNTPTTTTTTTITTRPVTTLTRQTMGYLTVKGIESETSYLVRDWPLFALKEPADNGYDFLNDCYPNASKEARKIMIRAWMDSIPNVNDRLMLR